MNTKWMMRLMVVVLLLALGTPVDAQEPQPNAGEAVEATNDVTLPFTGVCNTSTQICWFLRQTGVSRVAHFVNENTSSSSSVLQAEHRGSGNAIEGFARSGRGVFGLADNNAGVLGRSNSLWGVRGESASGHGVYGQGKTGVEGVAITANGTGVRGESANGGYGVVGTSSGIGVFGTSAAGTGVSGFNNSADQAATSGVNVNTGPGVKGQSLKGTGVAGISATDAVNVFGVRGDSTKGVGVGGYSEQNSGVYGTSQTGPGVWGDSQANTGVFGRSAKAGNPGCTTCNTLILPTEGGVGVLGENNLTNGIGVRGQANAGIALDGRTVSGTGVRGVSTSGVGVFGKSESGYAGRFDGKILVEGNATIEGETTVKILHITGGSDVAEPFKMAEGDSVKAGHVVSIDPAHPGQLRLATRAYDRTVAGVVSGANGINPGLVLKQPGSLADGSHPVALSGRVYVWADASAGPIQPGDLLTTANRPGHAMRVSDYAQAQGAILGKAMSSLDHGTGLVLVLVSLQ